MQETYDQLIYKINFSGCSVFSFDATQRLDAFSPNLNQKNAFAVLFVNGGTRVNIAPQEMGAQNLHF